MAHRGLAWIAALVLGANPAASRGADLFIVGPRVVDVEAGTVSAPRDIEVADGRIVSITPSGTRRPRPNITTIEAAGRFAFPGLIDVHAHLGDGGAAAQTEEDQAAALAQFVRYGVTTIFTPGGTAGAEGDLAAWRARCRQSATCPGLYGSGALITARGGHPVTTIFGLTEDASDAELLARGVIAVGVDEDVAPLIEKKAAAGVDAVKIVIEDGPRPWRPKPRLSDLQIAAIVQAAHARGLRVYAHVSTPAHVEAALRGGADGVMHGPLEPLAQATIEEMAKRGMVYVPTLSLYDGLHDWALGRPEDDPYALKGVSKKALESLAHPGFLSAAPETLQDSDGYVRAASNNLARAAAAGVPIALGTDTNNPFVYPGYAVHEELELMVRAGLTPRQALHAATLGAAAFLGRQDRLGRIAEGYEADLLLTEANPLANVNNLREATVVHDGQVAFPHR